MPFLVSHLTRRVFGLACFAAMSFPATAQQPDTIRSVSFLRIKPERIGDFNAVVKEIHAVFAKAGLARASTFWQSLVGPREVVLVTHYRTLADLDETMQSNPKL